MSAPKQQHIGLSLGMIDSLSDGLGEFSTQLCERVAKAAPAWREKNIHFHLHMPQRWHGRFGDNVSYITTSKLQGYWHWQGRPHFSVWHAFNQLGRIIPPFFTSRSVLTIHDLNFLYHENERRQKRALTKLQGRLRKFDEVTTLTRYVEKDIQQRLGWTGPVTVIPNGARDLTTHAQEPIPDLPAGRFLLHLSRLAASKNPGCLVELAAAWPEQVIVLAGPYSVEAEHFRMQAQRRGLHNLRLLREVSDAQKTWLYAHCQAFLFPSLTEGFGLPPLEAMHFGKPVFLSDRTSLPEVGGSCASYFKSFDPLAMRNQIETDSPGLLARTAAIRTHAANFSWDKTMVEYMKIYQRMLA